MTDLKKLLEKSKQLRNAATSGPWKLMRDPVKLSRILLCADVVNMKPNFDAAKTGTVSDNLQNEIIAKIEYEFCDAPFIAHACNTEKTKDEIILVLIRGLESIVRHYDHPNHDHNWAYHTNDVVRNAILDANELSKKCLERYNE